MIVFRTPALQHPAGIAVLLGQLGRVGLPVLGNFTLFQCGLLAITVALVRSLDDRGIDNLPPIAR